MQPQQLAGPKCGRRYEKEYLNKFRDCITFYRDGKVRFERFCYGEGACFVFGAWAAISPEGALSYTLPLDPAADPQALPQALTGVEGSILYFDGKRPKWQLEKELDADPKNGYGKLKMALLRVRGK